MLHICNVNFMILQGTAATRTKPRGPEESQRYRGASCSDNTAETKVSCSDNTAET